MADTKITALTAITTVDPAADVLPIVDVSDTSMAASGTTKKITSNQILGAGGTATLASATITGDLTVDTNVLKVDTTNNRVGIGTASPLGPFHLVTTAAGFSEAGYFENSQAVGANVGPRVSLLGAGSVAMSLIQSGWNAAANTDAYLAFLTRGSGAVNERYRIASDGVATWSNVGGVAGTAMTLNATGLGVGVSPSYQIHARKDQAAFTTVAIDNQNAIAAGTGTQFLLIDGGVNAGWFRRNRDGSGNTDIGYKDALRFRGQIAGTERTDMTLDSSGNVISNVTSTAPTLGTNNQMVFNLTSNTNLRISVRGSDGTTRVANITLA